MRQADTVRRQNGVSRFDSIGGGQVIVFTSIDDDSCKTVDNAAEKLVYERSLRVDGLR